MRRRSIAFGIVAAVTALVLAAGPAGAGDRERGIAGGAAIALGAGAGALLHPPVVVQPAPVVVPGPVVIPPPVVVVTPPPPSVVVVRPAPVLVVRHGPGYGFAWGYWKHHRPTKKLKVEWYD